MKTSNFISKDNINKIFVQFSSDNPVPKTELNYTNNYTLLIAIVMSAQATDKSVNKATESLFQVVDSPVQMIKLGEENLKKYIKGIGLYNAKAKNIIALSKVLHEQYNDLVPANFDDLVNLPGVGRKTAKVMLNCAFDQDVIAVDTHVFRVGNRIGIAQSNNILETERQLEQNIPREWKKYAHHWLILHGRYICKARKPLCNICKINDYCQFYDKNIT